jgi:hypothetical protein
MVGSRTELASVSPAGDDAVSPSLGATRVLFLGGLGRSGTTVLERLLDREPQVQALGEVVHLWQRSVRDNELCGCGVAFRDCPFWARVGQVAFGGWGGVDVDRVLSLRDRVDRSKRVPKLVSGLTSSAWRRDLSEYVSYYERLYSAAREVSGCDVVVDSSKQASLPYCLSTSDQLDLRVLHCIRDSRAVAYSQSKDVERPEGTSEESRQMHRLRARGSAFYWVLHNLEVDLYGARNGQTLRLRYEDWVEDPARALDDIRRFAGLAVPAARLAPDSDDGSQVILGASHTCSGNPMRFTRGAVHLRNDDRWRRQMRRRDVVVVTALTGPLLKRYGYFVPRERSTVPRA